MYVVYEAVPGQWRVMHVVDGEARICAGAVDEPHARRIAQLLTRHGMVDAELDEPAEGVAE